MYRINTKFLVTESDLPRVHLSGLCSSVCVDEFQRELKPPKKTQAAVHNEYLCTMVLNILSGLVPQYFCGRFERNPVNFTIL